MSSSVSILIMFLTQKKSTLQLYLSKCLFNSYHIWSSFRSWLFELLFLFLLSKYNCVLCLFRSFYPLLLLWAHPIGNNCCFLSHLMVFARRGQKNVCSLILKKKCYSQIQVEDYGCMITDRYWVCCFRHKNIWF